jgi:glycerate-2-kinase
MLNGETEETLLFDAARAVYEAALGAVMPRRLVKASVVRDGNTLRIVGETFDLASFENVRLMAFGKGAADMAEALAVTLGERLTGGLVIVPGPSVRIGGAEGKAREERTTASLGDDARRDPRLEYVVASHPLPDERSVKAARRALDLASKAGEKGLVVFCISGGASSLLCLPADGISLDEKKRVTGGLLRAGASIKELNVVRKHLSRVKGGRLAKAASPAKVINLIISDVNGDDLETIASGPTHWDSSTFAEARGVLEKYGLWASAPASVRTLVEKGLSGDEPETLKSGDAVFENVHTFVIGNNLTALRGARREAERLGFEPFVLTSSDEGEARKAARDYVAFIASLACSMSAAPKPRCLLAGGELTVSVKGKGTGGRNMEFVLAALVEMREEGLGQAFCGTCELTPEGGGQGGVRPFEWLTLSIGTDGIDGPTDAAGAWADPSTLERARELGLEPERYLDDNDSYSFFKKTGNLIVTGPTGTNVCDIRIFLLRPA